MSLYRYIKLLYISVGTRSGHSDIGVTVTAIIPATYVSSVPAGISTVKKSSTIELSPLLAHNQHIKPGQAAEPRSFAYKTRALHPFVPTEKSVKKQHPPEPKKSGYRLYDAALFLMRRRFFVKHLCKIQ